MIAVVVVLVNVDVEEDVVAVVVVDLVVLVDVVVVSFDERVVGVTIGGSSCRRSRVLLEARLYTRGIQGLSSMKCFSTIERQPRK